MDKVEPKNNEKFAKIILEFARVNNLNLVEALVSYCEDNEMEMEDVIKLLDKSMKKRIEVEAIENRYVVGQKISKLPI
jgi:hypothetical protein